MNMSQQVPFDHHRGWAMRSDSDDQGLRCLDAHLNLLDRQVLDAQGVPIAVRADMKRFDLYRIQLRAGFEDASPELP
jgi:hypothetical protein